MFPEDMPTELTQIPPPTLRAAAHARPPLEARPVALREVDGERKSDESQGGDAPRGRSHLRLIKS